MGGTVKIFFQFFQNIYKFFQSGLIFMRWMNACSYIHKRSCSKTFKQQLIFKIYPVVCNNYRDQPQAFKLFELL